MRTKLAQWMVACTQPLTMAVVACGTCFARSGAASGPEYGAAERSNGAPGDVLVAAVLPMPAGANAAEPAEKPLITAQQIAPPARRRPESRTGEQQRRGVSVFENWNWIEDFPLWARESKWPAPPLANKFNIRGGFNMIRLNHTLTDNGIHYDGQLRFQSAEAHLDWFPFWGFHISPGLLFYNGNQATATAMVPGSQTFTVGGTTYESDPSAPVTGSAKLDFVKVSPTIMLGVGNLIPRSGRHYSFLFEIGGAYQGSARVALNLAGNVCNPGDLTTCRAISSDPTVQANVQAQQVKIQNDVNPYRFYPVISLGVGFNF